jgi:hypothetical protein
MLWSKPNEPSPRIDPFIGKSTETIVAAAIKDIDGKIHYMSSPARHHHVIWWMVGRYDKLTDVPTPNNFEQVEQGFLTSTGRYVNRVEAGIIAIQCGQIQKLQHGPALYSEDLW